MEKPQGPGQARPVSPPGPAGGPEGAAAAVGGPGPWRPRVRGETGTWGSPAPHPAPVQVGVCGGSPEAAQAPQVQVALGEQSLGDPPAPRGDPLSPPRSPPPEGGFWLPWQLRAAAEPLKLGAGAGGAAGAGMPGEGGAGSRGPEDPRNPGVLSVALEGSRASPGARGGGGSPAALTLSLLQSDGRTHGRTHRRPPGLPARGPRRGKAAAHAN